MQLASFILRGLIRHMMYNDRMKKFKSSTEKNYTNLNTNKCNKTPLTDIIKKPIVQYTSTECGMHLYS